MSRVGFQPTIQAFEQAKTVHVLDRTATVVGKTRLRQIEILCILFSTHNVQHLTFNKFPGTHKLFAGLCTI
jgi:hypothetical protein